MICENWEDNYIFSTNNNMVPQSASIKKAGAASAILTPYLTCWNF
jgi:hypothetical protein